jgi:hypothetical protein
VVKRAVLLTCSLFFPMALFLVPTKVNSYNIFRTPVTQADQTGHGLPASACAHTAPASDIPSALAFTASGLPQSTNCADPIDKCQKPVKYLGSKADCSCFACEYGKATQHNVCTKNKADKDALFRLATAE